MKLSVMEARYGLYNYEEALQVLGIPERDFADLVASGVLVAIRRWGQVNFDPEDIELVRDKLAGNNPYQEVTEAAGGEPRWLPGRETEDEMRREWYANQSASNPIPFPGDQEAGTEEPPEFHAAVNTGDLAAAQPAQTAHTAVQPAASAKQWSAPSPEWDRAKAGGKQLSQEQLKIIEVLRGVVQQQGIEHPEEFINALYSVDPRRAMAYNFLKDGQPGDSAVGRLPIPGSKGEFRKVNIEIAEAEDTTVSVSEMIQAIGMNELDANNLMATYGVRDERYDLGTSASSVLQMIQPEEPAAAAVGGAELGDELGAELDDPAATTSPTLTAASAVTPPGVTSQTLPSVPAVPTAEDPAAEPEELPGIGNLFPNAPPSEPTRDNIDDDDDYEYEDDEYDENDIIRNPEALAAAQAMVNRARESGEISGEIDSEDDEDVDFELSDEDIGAEESEQAAPNIPKWIMKNLELGEPLSAEDRNTLLAGTGFNPEQWGLYRRIAKTLVRDVTGIEDPDVTKIDPEALDSLANIRTGSGLAQLGDMFQRMAGDRDFGVEGGIERKIDSMYRDIAAEDIAVDTPIEFDWPEDAF
jgi:hypothetical protein